MYVCVCVCIARVSGALPLAKLLLIDADDANADDDVPMPILPESHAVAFYTRVRMHAFSSRWGSTNKHAPVIFIIINISVAAASRALPCPAGGASEANASTDCAVPGSGVSSPVLPSGRSHWNLHTYVDGGFPTVLRTRPQHNSARTLLPKKKRGPEPHKL